MKSTCKILFYPKKTVVDENGLSPIMGRITVSGDRKTFSTKLLVNAKNNWSKDKGKAKGNSIEIERLNTSLLKIREKLEAIKDDLFKANGYISAIEIRDAYIELTKTPEQRVKEQAEQARLEQERLLKEQEAQELKEIEELGISLIEYFNNYIESRRSEVSAGQLTNKTFSRYENCRDRLLLYMLEEYGDWMLPLKQVDYYFVKGFEMFIYNNFECGNNTVMKIIQKLDTVMTLAFNTGVISRNPFALFKYHKEETHRDIINDDELDRMYKYDFKNQTLEAVRDNYVFSCWTGLSYIDGDTLAIDDIKQFFDGNDWIFKNREKTNVESKIRLFDVPKAILKKYEGKLPKGQLLPFISNTNTNKYLKIIAAKLGIDKKLTFHTARHTFATTICLSNGVPLETIQKALGHKSIRTTQIYAKILDIKLVEDMNALSERLQDMKEQAERETLPMISAKANSKQKDIEKLAAMLSGKHDNAEIKEIVDILQRIAG